MALLQLKQINREFNSGEQRVRVLKDINLSIEAGEFVAIVGASGSGKSTLMNLLGCLDKASSGDYLVAGKATGQLDSDALAELRREHFGFIFQRYHLLGDLSALGNAEIPAIYAGKSHTERRQRATALLTRLGLGERLHYRPGQLSGGQQQRVSIARALINGGEVILADEPTGALDSHSGEEVLNILRDLHQQGHTVVIVTHDMRIAQNADRIIEIHDGEIIADNRSQGVQQNMRIAQRAPAVPHPWRALRDRLNEAFKMALVSMMSQRLRTFLTMLGIIIGIASVVSVVALGKGSQQKILQEISSMGTSTLDVFPGTDFGDMNSARIQTLRPSDADALAQQPYVHSVTPSITNSTTLKYRNQALTISVNGVGEQFFAVRGYRLSQGMAFNRTSVDSVAQEAVIDENTLKKLFPNRENPLGEVIMLGNMPVRIVGVATRQSSFGRDSNLNIWVPYTTAMKRMIGKTYLSGITVRIKDNIDLAVAEQGVTKLLQQRHGSKDFFIMNTDSIRNAIESTTNTMTLLVAAIALISLLVGGIGVMNIMLVSVTERTREIGVRMAVGARASDIMQQFLIEAVLVCITGGIIGVLLALLPGVLLAQTSSNFAMIYSPFSIIAAFICSSLIGVLFGFFPARRAARMDPIHALERE
ncbi:MacB family efflux pump subunit [Erwiniaceae bacterium BAC15a-03b]|uniref:Pyoverdine export ATP-binding/permease protein PvdT n=1 Tax=Winslowiella arboricola TaxID=2978220 RepID=A0A9J6PIM0_9GAMM|nr:MacB family efflux pump subunit [Winslowiella arboricola]MCU5771338.1 MacB family efflux pump subunit [Winslowiella arboricola]MCU5777210.1 MacB family efflux pump subunit [Winslowiella arboricola]